MAELLCNNPDALMVRLFGQRLSFTKLSQGSVQCTAKRHPFPNVTDTQANWIARVHEAVLWFDGASPRNTIDLDPVFEQNIRLRESPPGTLICEALHDGVPGATEDPAQLEAILDTIETWFAAAGVTP